MPVHVMLGSAGGGRGVARMLTFSVQSGSNGNCIYVEAGDTRLLFDAGVSGKTARMRMRQHGRDPTDVDALFISHDHDDHIRSAGIFQRLFGVPLHVTPKTLAACRSDLGRLHDVRHFAAGQAVQVGAVTVRTFPTPHDAADGVAFVVEFDGLRLGIFTDLGHVFSGLDDVLREVDAAYLESNYDPTMLASGPYPAFLKQRIFGNGGHISNFESADLVRRTACSRAKWIALAHLSEQNNSPELALETHRKAVGHGFPYALAPRYEVSPVLEL